MKVEFRKKFLKELAKIPNNHQNNIEEFVFETLVHCEYLGELGNIEKMKGYKDYFKIRFGDYRLGIKKNNDIITVETVKHRKEIYNFFP